MWISIGCLFVMLILGFIIGFKVCVWYFENKEYYLVCNIDEENDGIQIVGLLVNPNDAYDIAIEAHDLLKLDYRVIPLKLNSVDDYFEEGEKFEKILNDKQVKKQIDKLISDVENNE